MIPILDYCIRYYNMNFLKTIRDKKIPTAVRLFKEIHTRKEGIEKVSQKAKSV